MADADPGIIAVSPALGHEGVQAVVQYYESGAGRASLLLAQANKPYSLDNIYESRVYGTTVSYVPSVIDFKSPTNETIMAFWADELHIPSDEFLKKHGIADLELTEYQACLYGVAHFLREALTNRAGADVTIQVKE